jgi:hypothetical protein
LLLTELPLTLLLWLKEKLLLPLPPLLLQQMRK